MCDRTPDHVEYGSRAVAENAAYLHQLRLPCCAEIVAFPCGDHWHIGHPSRAVGDACKAISVHYRRGVPIPVPATEGDRS